MSEYANILYHFTIRSSYARDKKKEFAPNCAAYYPFGVDVFLCQQKINHISRFVELPVPNTTTKFPPLLVVNVQVLFVNAATKIAYLNMLTL